LNLSPSPNKEFLIIDMASNRKRKARFFKQSIILILIVAAFGGGFYVYSESLKMAKVVCGVFKGSASTSPKLCFEIAETEAKRAKGLMFRKPEDLAETAGMIFIYPEEDERSFWMKNTITALDMIFLSADKLVVGIVENAAPLSHTPRKVDRPSQFIVELHAGSARKWNISVGDALELDSALPLGED
jgi:uncharacterized membrane protein (UPF0127 family)